MHRKPMWPNGLVGDEFAPPAIPPCGFRGELCPVSSSKHIHLLHQHQTNNKSRNGTKDDDCYVGYFCRMF